MRPGRKPDRREALASALEQACDRRGVTCAREDIPYGIKMTLSQGAASGVIAIYSTGKVVPNPHARQHFADILAAWQSRAPGADAPRAARAEKPKTPTAGVAYPCLGSDESGKGDYFGPLVAAAVLVLDEREEALLRELGVRDSKELSSPREAREIAGQIREVCAGRFGEVVVEPEDYNGRFAARRAVGSNSHGLLAEAHAEAMARALAACALKPAFAMTDKFGTGKEIEHEKKRRGLDFKLRQETKGERYTAVAAASILARDRCLEWFAAAESRAGERLPRGAFDPGIITAARRIFATGGLEGLGRFAKLHFRTTEKVTR